MKTESIDYVEKITDLFYDLALNSEAAIEFVDKFPGRQYNSPTDPTLVKRISNEVDSPALIFAQTFLKDLERAYTTIPENKDDVFSDDVGYCFPCESTIKSYNQNPFDVEKVDHETSQNEDDLAKYINRNKEALEAWTDSFLTSIKDQRGDDFSSQVRVLVGKYGCGKSTLVKAIKRGFLDKFNDANTLCSIVDYESISDSLFNADVCAINAILIDRFYNQIIRDISENADMCERLNSEVFTDFFVEAYSEKLQGKLAYDGRPYDNDKLLSMAQIESKRVLSRIARGGGRKKLTRKSAATFSLEAKEAIINFLANEGFSFLITVDGLDRLSVEEFVSEKFNKIAKSFSYIILNKGDSHFDLETPIHFLLTLRNCTYQEFYRSNQEFTTEHSKRVQVLSVAPVAPLRILKRGIRSLRDCSGSNAVTDENIEKLESFTEEVYDMVSRAFSLKQQTDLIEVFNRNHRKLIRFFLNVFTYAIQSLMRFENKPKDLDELIALLIERRGDIKDRSYIFVEILMLGPWPGFNNYFSINAKRNGEYHIKDIKPNVNHGDLDNLYNYQHYSKKGELSHVLIKLRILQFLCTKPAYRSRKAIHQFLINFGYTISDKELEIFMSLLVHADLVKVSMRPDGLAYHSTTLGKHLISKPAIELEYIENVASATLLPLPFSVKVEGFYRYDCELFEWVQLSTINSFIFFHVVKMIEAAEREFLKNTSKTNSVNYDRYFISEKLRCNLVKSLRGVLNNPVSGKNVPVKQLYNRLVRHAESWRKHHLCGPEQGQFIL
ncbi:MAG: hypothetical protein ACSHYA_18475 [Opitutaceae bacterium]